MTGRPLIEIPPERLDRLRDLVESESGVVLNDAKLPHLASVVRERMEFHGIGGTTDYIELVSDGEDAAGERRALVEALLVGETHFFRTPAVFRALEEAILPGLVERGFVPPLPVWCAGCATGEEAYSVAISAIEWSRGRHTVPVRVRATDLHSRFLDAAREGVYPSSSFRDLPGRIRDRYFEPVGDGRCRVAEEVRRLVDFEELNLVDFLAVPPAPPAYAAILCRNVMIYFRSELTRRLVERFHGSLLEGGVLFLGHSETLWGISDAFRLEQREKVFFYRKPAPGGEPGRSTPGLPPFRKAPPRRIAPRRPPAPTPPAPEPSPAMKLVLAAERLADEGRFEDAVAMCRRASAADPGCPEPEYLMSFLLRGKERHAEALYHAERALDRDPRFVFADMEAAECLSGMGRASEAALRWKGILRSIEGDVRLPRLSVGAGFTPKTLREYVSSRLAR
ncbi:MAG: protein-glutamate O-methyltransferase CheR [Deltaproteobacteria bacterium]